MDKIFSGHQPNFLPYMGFFHKMNKSDIFVLDDDVQFSNDAYHNYNFIKVGGQKYRMTVPVSYSHGDMIKDVRICYERKWDYKLLKTIEMNYRKAPYFDDAFLFLESHLRFRFKYLYELNITILIGLREKFGIDTEFMISSVDAPTKLHGNDRNIYQCKKFDCNVCLSGDGGRDYNDEGAYKDNGLKLVYDNYEPISYRQQGNCFIKNLSVLDYIFNEGFNIPKEWIIR